MELWALMRLIESATRLPWEIVRLIAEDIVVRVRRLRYEQRFRALNVALHGPVHSLYDLQNRLRPKFGPGF